MDCKLETEPRNVNSIDCFIFGIPAVSKFGTGTSFNGKWDPVPDLEYERAKKSCIKFFERCGISKGDPHSEPTVTQKWRWFNLAKDGITAVCRQCLSTHVALSVAIWQPDRSRKPGQSIVHNLGQMDNSTRQLGSGTLRHRGYTYIRQKLDS
ncbi:hypothetical protein CIHG_06366 [Coccidioides immitis H538.4]|uniref:Uncharacterized protein n=2 Tax=Coccidioides immitis TaxID=5501 RepID=A0A0J8RVH0_COCIT|nr:hypothetical protein CIRG_09643 [Coccidioides immitis RMSCC 2394]KMU88566.1 hypothetical protein CIHG_06366 [Coccidioides immitis H538.4]